MKTRLRTISVLASATLSIAVLALPLHLTGVHAAPQDAQPLHYDLALNWTQPAQTWGTMSAVDIDTDGTIYILQRSGADGTPSSAIMVFDKTGKLLRTWGQGDLPADHGLRVAPDHTIWVTDRKLEQAIQYDRSGKVLMTLGTKNVAGDNTSETAFNGVADIAFGKNGDLFIADGEGANTRVIKFSKAGKFLKMWGTAGDGPSQFNVPHGIAIDPRGRVWVCDRSNKRVEIFDQDGKFLEQTTKWGAASSVAFKNGMAYVADFTPENRILVGTLDGKILGEIDGVEGVHGIAVDADGAVYAAETTGKTVNKYSRR
jgi:DNA-binding beta-propeller fold protein YncE